MNPGGQNTIVAQLPSQSSAALRKIGSVCLLEVGQWLDPAGASDGHLYFPQTAILSMVVEMDNGETAGTAIIGSDGLYGGSELFAETQALVIATGSVLRVPAHKMPNAILESEAMGGAIVAFQQKLGRQVNRLAACNALHSLEQRLCRWLLEVARRQQRHNLEITQDMLASILGVHRTSVLGALQKLRASGAIAEHQRGILKVAGLGVLEAMTCECARG